MLRIHGFLANRDTRYSHRYSAEQQYQKLWPSNCSNVEICCLISLHSVDQTEVLSRQL